jgi:preprotein translocase subunit SecG
MFVLLRGVSLGLSTFSLATVPLATAWLVLALALGLSPERRAREADLRANDVAIPNAKRSLT